MAAAGTPTGSSIDVRGAEEASLPLPGSVPAVGREAADDEAWVGLGSNLGNRAIHVTEALESLGPWLVEVSPVYETAPWGIVDQSWFLNLVARLRWADTARDLLDLGLCIERSMGRIRQARFGPRCIDIDVLIVGRQQIEESGLVVPHPGISHRRSVLEPWADLCPDLQLPGLARTVGELREAARSLDDQEVRLWSSAG